MIKMKRRTLYYGLTFVFFFVLDRIAFLPVTIGGFLLLGFLSMISLAMSDLIIQSMKTLSDFMATPDGKVFFTLGPKKMREVGDVPALFTEEGDLAYKSVKVVRLGGLSCPIIPNLAGGGRKGYMIYPNFAVIKLKKAGNEIVLGHPWRLSFASLPPEWRDCLLQCEKFNKETSPIFIVETADLIEKLIIPEQLKTYSKMEIGTTSAQVIRANEAKTHDELMIKKLRSDIVVAQRMEEGRERRKIGDILKDVMKGGEGDTEQE